MTDWNVYEHHRGPYVLGVMREVVRRKGATVQIPYHYDLLPGHTEVDDIVEEARALLTDPRDTVTSVYVFSASEQAHVTTYTKDNIDRK